MNYESEDKKSQDIIKSFENIEEEVLITKAIIPKYKNIEIIIGSILLVFAIIIILIAFYNNNLSIFIIPGSVSIFVGYMLIKTPNITKIPPDYLDRLADIKIYNETVGFLGFFKGINVTGLPLVTISITIIFCILAISSYGINAIGYVVNIEKQIIPDDFPKLVLELSKLTLGAFIGSFVSEKK